MSIHSMNSHFLKSDGLQFFNRFFGLAQYRLRQPDAFLIRLYICTSLEAVAALTALRLDLTLTIFQ